MRPKCSKLCLLIRLSYRLLKLVRSPITQSAGRDAITLSTLCRGCLASYILVLSVHDVCGR